MEADLTNQNEMDRWEKELVLMGTSRIWAISLALLGIFLVTRFSANGAKPGISAQGANPRGTNSGNPDLDGIWQAITTANWDIQDHSAKAGPASTGAFLAEPPGQGIVEGNEIP